jgi:hypothetical protein
MRVERRSSILMRKRLGEGSFTSCGREVGFGVSGHGFIGLFIEGR